MPNITITTIPEADDIVIDGVSMNDVAAFQSECLTDGVVTCGWDALHTKLNNLDVSRFWWFLTEAERRSIAEMAIKNTLFEGIMYGRTGEPNCAGGIGNLIYLQCVPNAIIRYVKFGSGSPGGSNCYYQLDDEEHCYVPEKKYNLPCNMVAAIGKHVHILCAIHVTDGIDSLDNWIIFQYHDFDIKPGERSQIPLGATVRIDKVDTVGCYGYHSTDIASFDT